MFRPLARLLVLFAAVQILGGHWAVLQTVAWTTMLVEYAQRDSLAVAVAKTFDGAHPCSICHTVTEGRKQEQQKDDALVIVKLDAVLASVVHVPAPLEQLWVFPVQSMIAAARSAAPPTPPPLA